MINSMTGYGNAEGQLNGVTYAVEIRAVNNRYFKASVKLPEMAAFLEEDIEKLLRESLSRGTVNYALRLKNVSANVLFDIDEVALRAYMERLGRIACSAEVKCPIDIGSLLMLPGILTPALPDEQKAEQIKNMVLSVTHQALNQLKQMRSTEGAALAADLSNHCEAIKHDLEQIIARREKVLRQYHKKLKKRVNELLAGAKLKLDEETLAKEVAVFAERSDISEEVSRLNSHLQQFAESCQQKPFVETSDNSSYANTQAGRRLEFICQEMLREANTIASKASDDQIARYVVDIKCRIDRIKEQVQNIV